MSFFCSPPLKVSERHLWRADAKGEKAHPHWAEARHLLKKDGSSKQAYDVSRPILPLLPPLVLACGRRV
jgi:hypothetical protein